MAFFALVSIFDKRCEMAGLRFQRRLWDRTRVFNYICTWLLKYHSPFRKEFFRLWTDLADQVDAEEWKEEKIRNIITRAKLLATGGLLDYLEGGWSSTSGHTMMSNTRRYDKITTIDRKYLNCFWCRVKGSLTDGKFTCNNCHGKKKVKCKMRSSSGHRTCNGSWSQFTQ